MSVFFLTLIATVSVLFTLIFLYRVLVKYLAEKVTNVRKYVPKWSTQLVKNVDLNSINHQKIQFRTKNNILIDALLIFAANSAKGNILFIHGIRTNKYYYFNEAVYFSKKNFNCILMDLRGHGESEGTYTTFGYFEKTDISLLIDNLTSKYNLPGKYGIWGHSLGASIAIQTLELDKRIGFGILEAPFSSLNKILKEYYKKKNLYLIPFLYYNMIKRVEQILGFKLDNVDPAESAKKVEQTIILLHGTDDERIEPYHSNLIYNNLPSSNKIIYQVKNANHYNIKDVWEKEYFEISLAFINNYVSKFQFIN